MAMEITDNNNKVQNFFELLEDKRKILTKCTDIYKTLTSQFTSIEQTITVKSQTLDSKLQNTPKTLENLKIREDSIPERLDSLSSVIESQKETTIAEFEKPAPPDDAPLTDALINVCRKMDHSGLLKLIVARRKESGALREEIPKAMNESVDSIKLMLYTVREFVEHKAAKRGGMTDKRRACVTLVASMFPAEELVEKKDDVGPRFSKAMVELAEEVVNEWREAVEKVKASYAGKSGGGGGGDDNGEGLNGMGPAEASMILQIILGFGLKEKFEDEFYRNLVVEFASRKDMPKLSMAIFGDKIEDVIEELVKNGKQVEAIYFATECGLIESFQPVPLLKVYLQNSRNHFYKIKERGYDRHAASDEADAYDLNSIKSIIKCVEDHNIESEFPLESLRKRLAILEKAKIGRKALAAAPRPSHKRRNDRGASRNSRPPPRPAKVSKYSGPYASFGQRNPVSAVHQTAVSRYPSPYNYSTYDAERTIATSTYGTPSYGSPYVPPPAQVTPQHYGVPGPSDSVGGVAGQLGGTYGGQAVYGSYEYSAVAPPSYNPPSYT